MSTVKQSMNEHSAIIMFIQSIKNETISNYILFSKFCIIGKMIERLVYSYSQLWLDINIIPTEHSFHKGRCSISNLVQLNNFITGAMSEEFQVDIVYSF